MDSDKRSAQVERLEVVETGRRRRWSEEEKLKIVLEIAGAAPGRGDGAAIRHFALVTAPMAPVVSTRAEGYRRAMSGLPPKSRRGGDQ